MRAYDKCERSLHLIRSGNIITECFAKFLGTPLTKVITMDNRRTLGDLVEMTPESANKEERHYKQDSGPGLDWLKHYRGRYTLQHDSLMVALTGDGGNQFSEIGCSRYFGRYLIYLIHFDSQK